MKRVSNFLNVGWIVVLVSLFIVPVVFAQDGTETPLNLLAPFAPVLAASAAIERLLQLVRNIVSPNPEDGPLKRGKNLQLFTTYGGVVLGLAMTFMSPNLRLLSLAGIQFDPLLDRILTGVVIGMGTEFVHEVIKVVGEGKDALRATAKAAAGPAPAKTQSKRG